MPNVVENIFNDSFKLVDFTNLVALNDVSEDSRIIYVADNGVYQRRNRLKEN